MCSNERSKLATRANQIVGLREARKAARASGGKVGLFGDMRVMGVECPPTMRSLAARMLPRGRRSCGIVFELLRSVFLVLVFLPFAAISAWSGRLWTVALPVIFWGGLAWLQSLGILQIFSGSGASMLATGGVVFAGVGVAVHPRLRPHIA